MSEVVPPTWAEKLCEDCRHTLNLDVWECTKCLSTFALPIGHLPQACPSCGMTNSGRIKAA